MILSTSYRGAVYDDCLWQVSFMDYEMGYFDEKSKRFEPGPNPFASKV